MRLIRDSSEARHADDLRRAEKFAVEAVDLADTRDRLLFGRPQAYFNLYRAREAAGLDVDAVKGFSKFGDRFGYHPWILPWLLRAQSRLLAIGVRRGDHRLVAGAIAEGSKLYRQVSDEDVRIEYWHRLAIWAMESERYDAARELFRRCEALGGHDPKYRVAAQMARTSLMAATGKRDDARLSFLLLGPEAKGLGMIRASRIAGDHLAASLST